MLVHSHPVVAARYRNFSGNMVIDRDGSRYLSPDKYRRVAAVALICGDTFARMGWDQKRHIDYRHECGIDSP